MGLQDAFRLLSGRGASESGTHRLVKAKEIYHLSIIHGHFPVSFYYFPAGIYNRNRLLMR